MTRLFPTGLWFTSDRSSAMKLTESLISMWTWGEKGWVLVQNWVEDEDGRIQNSEDDSGWKERSINIVDRFLGAYAKKVCLVLIWSVGSGVKINRLTFPQPPLALSKIWDWKKVWELWMLEGGDEIQRAVLQEVRKRLEEGKK